jgi:hypothetical protein
MSYMFAAMFLFGAGVAVLAILIALWIALLTGDEP